LVLQLPEELFLCHWTMLLSRAAVHSSRGPGIPLSFLKT
jgi:hypothetical protein